MHEPVKKIAIQCAGIVLLASILIIIATNSIYYHSHKLHNGEVIAHAHPFNKAQDSTPFKTHQHSSVQLFFLEHMQLLFSILGFSVLLIVSSTFHLFYVAGKHHIYSTLSRLNSSRAPPFPV